MRYRITAPVQGVTTVVAGVRLVDSVGELDGDSQPSALAYFRRQRYRVEEIPEAEPEPDPEPDVEPEPDQTTEPEPKARKGKR